MQAEGEFALVIEKLEAALELPGQPVKRGTMAHKHIMYMMLAEAAAQLRDAGALARYATQLEELAVRDDHQPYLAVAHRAWGVVHRLNGATAEAGERLAQALALFEEQGASWQAGRTLAELGALALAQGDESGARDYYEQALAAFELMEALPDVERTRAALQAIG
ncbi:MAG TPA: tetratricopeptide repeat protein [Candidatus Binatia bacterium]|jgi:tetratricopeptide (TPR) repeat protein|nr:tetratricopeptide repeat protein [Candidatus Binatia bacterium]